MKILFVTDNRFWRKELGSHRRISSMVESLIRQGHEIEAYFTHFLFTPDIAALSKKPPAFKLHTLGERENSHRSSSTPGWRARVSLLKKILRQLLLETRRIFEKTPANGSDITRKFLLQIHEPKLVDFESEPVLAGFRETCQNFKPNVVIIEYVRLAWLLGRARDVLPEGCLSLIDTHDVQYERQSRFHARGEVHDLDITQAEEGCALAEADVVIAIQSADAEKLRELVLQREVIVAGFPCALHQHEPRPDGPVRIGFFGSSMLPNRQAAESLIRIIFPKILACTPNGVELHFFGGVCAELGQIDAGQGVFLHGFVDDLNAAYAGIDIIANPVSFGGGLKIKNVEALSHGRPLVTTPIGAEGLEEGAGSAFMLASSEAEFIEFLQSLVDSKIQREELGQSALAFARVNFSEEAVYQELGRVLAKHTRNVWLPVNQS